MSLYLESIKKLTDKNPRHIEAWMRVKHPTLDNLYPEEFAEDVLIAAACIDEVGDEESEELAQSMGLRETQPRRIE